MSWVTIIWSMIASACLTLALVHGFVWWRRREARANAIFALSALANAFLAACELAVMRSETTDQFGTALRWGHLPAWLAIVTLVAFVRVYLRAGRLWLAWTVVAGRTLSLALNFIFAPNINFREITGLRPVPFLGEFVATGEGVRNPWMLVGQFVFLLLAAFVIDALITIWRRGDGWQARFLIGTIVLFLVAAPAQAVLALWGLVQAPTTPSVFYMGVVLAMGAALSTGILRSLELAAELQESRRRMKLAAAAAKMAHWHWDLAADELWITPEGRELYGLPADATVTMKRLRETIHRDERAQVEAATRRRPDDAGEFHTDYRIVLPDGSVRWIREQAAAEADAAGRIRRLRGVSFDITRARKAEMEVQAQREELAHLSRVATLGESSGSLAHELNQPLTAILSNAQAALRFLAKPAIDRSELTDILQDIVAADERAGLIIGRLRLLFSKGQAQLEPLDGNEVVADVLKIIRGELLNAAVRVALETEADPPTVMGDRVQLQQVVLNLISNAIDAMMEYPESSRWLWVRTEHVAGAGVRVSVRDSGGGVAAEAWGRIFEPFFTTKKHGLGLGLAVCRTILAAHGCELTVENHPAGGARFHFTLPIANRNAP